MRAWKEQPVGIRAACITGLAMWSTRQPATQVGIIDNGAESEVSESTPGELELPGATEGQERAVDLSFVDYLETSDRLADRFFEREEFHKGLIGTRIKWEGIVSDVISRPEREVIAVIISPPEEFGRSGRALFSFPESLQTKLFSLRKDDTVIVEGIVRESDLLGAIGEGLSIEMKLQSDQE